MMLPLGDMLVIGEQPPKLLKALAVISAHLHPTYDQLGDIVAGHSKQTCLFASLAVRDFLVGIGFEDATVRTCAVLVRAYREDREVWSVGIGVPNQADQEGKFNGHAVVTVPSAALLIDTTLYQAQRPQFNGSLPGMLATSYLTSGQLGAMAGFAGAEFFERDNGLRFTVYYGDRPDINFRREHDFVRPQQRARRRAIARALVEQFGDFK